MTIQEAVHQSAQRLHRTMEEHCRLVALAGNTMAEGKIDLPLQAVRPEDCKIKRTLLEAVEVLEETRRSFKSKQLEQLRKKLLRLLVEIS